MELVKVLLLQLQNAYKCLNLNEWVPVRRERFGWDDFLVEETNPDEDSDVEQNRQQGQHLNPIR
jgi:hypothetical protein